MAERDPSPLAGRVSQRDRQTIGESTPAPDRPRDESSAGGSAPLLYVHDHGGQRYALPWQLGRDWEQFKSFAEDIYTHGKNKEFLDDIRSENFEVRLEVSNDDVIILPSVWNIVIAPGSVLHISFPSRDDFEPVTRRHSRRVTRASDDKVEFANIIVDDEEDEWYSGAPPPPQLDSDGEIDENNDSAVTGDDEEDSEPPPPPEQVRVPVVPTDQVGNTLSFTVDTKWGGAHPQVNQDIESGSDALKRASNGRGMTTENLKITKAVTITAEGRTAIQVHTLPGPENPAYSSSVDIRWYHIYADQLDWTQFKSTSLNIPSVSERLQTVMTKLFKKIEKDNLKAFLDGMFIEPGTVLRGDEARQPDAQSVIFSCIPYLEIQKPARTLSAQKDRLHPSRTLIQTEYPYEPVRDRDEEQAFRRFGNGRSDDLIHAPALWMLNIGPHIVVTCGYRPISASFVNSIEVFQEDLKQLGTGENNLTTIRLTDWNERVLFYSVDECRSYLEMEQRLRELRCLPSSGGLERSLQLKWLTKEGEKKIKPHDWPPIIQQSTALFIDISMFNEKDVTDMGAKAPTVDFTRLQTRMPSIDGVPPFFNWPNSSKDETYSDSFLPSDVRHSIRCLDQVEKAMLGESLLRYETIGAVDETFTSTKYYEALPEDSAETVQMLLLPQAKNPAAPGQKLLHPTHHQTLVVSKCSKLTAKAEDFISVVHQTLRLFVSDVDKSTMLRKLWGAMANIASCIETLRKEGTQDPDPQEYSDPKWKSPITGQRLWRIRTSSTPYLQRRSPTPKINLPLPDENKEPLESIEKCKLCSHGTPYSNPNDALEHLRSHRRFESGTQKVDPMSFPSPQELRNLKDWIYNEDEALLESTVTGAHAVLALADAGARDLLSELRELADGVRDEAGRMSERYTFPRKLLETLRRLIVFYLAAERSLHFTVESLKQTKKNVQQEDLPYTKRGFEVLKRFYEGVKTPLQQAREDLCYMVRSTTPSDSWRRLSLGPEYISSWFMRRLIVKPLDRSMSAADMYREYLSTLQFQVNHRPNKRLLRSINLLEEELRILSHINDWQTRLVENYLKVLDDTTYPVDIPSRRALYPYERLVLESCLENLALTRRDLAEQISRCGPLSDSTKQSAEINEEDHGKAILIFTVVTIIFLPLSFVTSYLGMNTDDIRNMNNKQSLFWEIAIPLTVVVMGTILLIAYNGDEIRDHISSTYRSLTGKQNRSISARGISVAQRERAAKSPSDSTSALDYKSLADEAEYATPKPDFWNETYGYGGIGPSKLQNMTQPTVQTAVEPMSYAEASFPVDDIEVIKSPRARISARPPVAIYNSTRMDDEYISTRLRRPPPPPLPPPSPLPPQRRRRRGHGYPNQLDEDSWYHEDPWYSEDPWYRSSAPHARPERPTYTKIHRKSVSPEALNLHAVPWEFDANDSNYVIVKQDLSPRLTNMLFAETKRLREKGSGRMGYDFGGEYDGEGEAKGEYTWVRKRRGGPGRRRDGARSGGRRVSTDPL